MKSAFLSPLALIAALFAEYSALHSLAVLPPVGAAAVAGAGDGAALAGAAAKVAAGPALHAATIVLFCLARRFDGVFVCGVFLAALLGGFGLRRAARKRYESANHGSAKKVGEWRFALLASPTRPPSDARKCYFMTTARARTQARTRQYVACYRVSTGRQQYSGLGLEAQRRADDACIRSHRLAVSA
jgi:hypothetical protein